MPWPDLGAPVAMRRVAVVAPVDATRAVLVAVAEKGVVELERAAVSVPGPASQALQRARRDRPGAHSSPVTTRQAPDLDVLEAGHELEALAGETEIEALDAEAVRQGSVAAWAGWAPAAAVAPLAERLAPLGGAVVPLRAPAGVDPPTLVEGRGATKAFQPLVDTYTTIGYRDLNPAAWAGLSYVVMFGMMFGDVGHGLVLIAGGFLLAAGTLGPLRRLRHLAPFVVGAGVASTGFGLAYGEFFGPTGVVPTLWLRPLDHATALLAVAVAAGAGLLAVSWVFGTVNRWREGGAGRALLAVSGFAGGALYLGLACAGLGWYRHWGPVELLGAGVFAAGLAAGGAGLYAESGRRAAGAVQAGVGLFDAVLRIGTNTVSFARLAAFGLTHAALSGIVWEATTGLWHRGAPWGALAAVVFLAGNALAFAIEGLVAGIQALRLEYYEMFSRIFAVEGHRFRPWHLDVAPDPVESEEARCSPG